MHVVRTGLYCKGQYKHGAHNMHVTARSSLRQINLLAAITGGDLNCYANASTSPCLRFVRMVLMLYLTLCTTNIINDRPNI